MRYHEIKQCRIQDSNHLISVLDLGHQALTGVFPRSADEPVTVGPLELMWCPDSGLLQLKHSYNPDEMYGENYGYRSGLNQSMVDHLTRKVHFLETLLSPEVGDVILDIGSNDATTLKAYSTKGLRRIGIDPVGTKFIEHYPEDIELAPTFFDAGVFNELSSKPAKIITSIAMFYDLENPIKFAQDIAEVLADDGVWHFEQSYMPSMLRTNSYDTICHEHIEYYSLGTVLHILQQAGLKLVDVAMNDVNGGSFAVTAAKKSNISIPENRAVIDWLLGQESRMGLDTVRPFRDFEERVYRHRQDLQNLVKSLVADGKKVLGYGASTKGNVMLQFCGFTASDIPAIAEVNPDKFGRVTPGTHIPIISEEQARLMQPDYFLVLPWHFKNGIVKREERYLLEGGKFIFPFPEIEIV